MWEQISRARSFVCPPGGGSFISDDAFGIFGMNYTALPALPSAVGVGSVKQSSLSERRMSAPDLVALSLSSTPKLQPARIQSKENLQSVSRPPGITTKFPNEILQASLREPCSSSPLSGGSADKLSAYKHLFVVSYHLPVRIRCDRSSGSDGVEKRVWSMMWDANSLIAASENSVSGVSLFFSLCLALLRSWVVASPCAFCCRKSP